MDSRTADIVSAVRESLGVADCWVTQPRIGSPSEADGPLMILVTPCGMMLTHYDGVLRVATGSPQNALRLAEDSVRRMLTVYHHRLFSGRPVATEDVAEVFTAAVERLSRVSTVADMWSSQ